MKGAVFNAFNELVESAFGLETWEFLLEETKPESGGVYTAAKTYPDEELLAMVGALSKHKEIPVPDLVFTFGEHLFGVLANGYPAFVEGKECKEFLLSVHDIVHVEVKKLFPDSGLPFLRYEDPGDGQLVMLYESPRKLCKLAEGLIQGSAKHFKKTIEIKHSECMNEGAKACRLELTIN